MHTIKAALASTVTLVALLALVPSAAEISVLVGNRPVPTAQLTLYGRVRDGQSGRPLAGATIYLRRFDPSRTLGSTTVQGDASGTYRLTVPVAPYLQIQATAPGHLWGRALIFTIGGALPNAVSQKVDIDGSSGPISAFHALDPLDRTDTVTPFPQQQAVGGVVTFSGRARSALQDRFAVTYPDGDAASLPLTVAGGHFSGRLPLDAGPGPYVLEVNGFGGAALFKIPIQVGPAAPPPSPLPVYLPDDAHLTDSQIEAAALADLNAVRRSFGRSVLPLSAAASTVARAHCRDVLAHPALYATPHNGSDGSTPWQRLRAGEVPFSVAGEALVRADLARGTWERWSTPSAIDGLMASPAHRINMLWGGYTAVGVGFARSATGGTMLTLDFTTQTTVPLTIVGAIRTASGATPLGGIAIVGEGQHTVSDAQGHYALSLQQSARSQPVTLTLTLPDRRVAIVAPTAPFDVSPLTSRPAPLSYMFDIRLG